MDMKELIELRIRTAKSQGYLDAVKDLRTLAAGQTSVELLLVAMIQNAIKRADEASSNEPMRT